jgi:formate hydrogenlyase subunit 3/multisubunit Na+/H+ antiporter MnhD subunit
MTALLWVAGFLSITGTPPFGTFMSEFTILNAAIDQAARIDVSFPSGSRLASGPNVPGVLAAAPTESGSSQ